MARTSAPFHLLAAAALLAIGGGAAAFAHHRFVPGEGLCAGLRIGGEPVPARTDLPAWVAERARAITARPVRLSVAGVDGTAREVPLADLGVRVDVDRVVALARGVGHEGTLADRVVEAWRAGEG